MLYIMVNGERHEAAGTETLAELLAKLKLNAQYLAVAVNNKVIPKSEYSLTKIKEGDALEVIHAVGGG
ncbi:MAG: thiamine biosynthesis protein ThiS [Deltaproteobacteria bacterium RIFCSPLOWO2_02_FULL_47_10]|nr:MAG: thiamine biosynthesis protein ThiS [Deltaproteobacteria bacterium RIFCSPLOWO2_02_FULL_47_10]